MFPPRATPILSGLILSGLMTFFVTGFATWRAAGMVDGYVGLWMGSWLTSWLFAFPLILVLRPLSLKIVGKMVRSAP